MMPKKRATTYCANHARCIRRMGTKLLENAPPIDSTGRLSRRGDFWLRERFVSTAAAVGALAQAGLDLV